MSWLKIKQNHTNLKTVLTHNDGDCDENVVVVSLFVLMQHKLIWTIKKYDQKPNKTAQALIA